MNLLADFREFHVFFTTNKGCKEFEKITVAVFHKNERNLIFSQTITRSFLRSFIITTDSRCAIQITTQRRQRMKNLQFVDRSNAIQHIEE